jgi:hypothetical protein
MEAGLVEIRQSSNRKAQFVSVTPRFSALVVRPSESLSSSSLYNSASSGHIAIPTSRSLQGWGLNGGSVATPPRGGGGASGFAGSPMSHAQSMPSLNNQLGGQQSLSAMGGIKEEDESHSALGMFDSSYDSLLGGYDDDDDDDDVVGGGGGGARGEVSDLSKIFNSFLIDPFSNSSGGSHGALGPEPLFPEPIVGPISDSQQPGVIGGARRPTPAQTPTSPWGVGPAAKAAPESPWAARPTQSSPSSGPAAASPWASGDSMWSGSRRVPGGGIQPSLSFAAMPAAPPIKLPSDESPWPPNAAGAMPHASSLPSFRTSGPPGLSSRGGGGAPWLSTQPTADWTNPGLTTAELTASMDWLSVSPKHSSRTK